MAVGYSISQYRGRKYCLQMYVHEKLSGCTSITRARAHSCCNLLIAHAFAHLTSPLLDYVVQTQLRTQRDEIPV